MCREPRRRDEHSYPVRDVLHRTNPLSHVLGGNVDIVLLQVLTFLSVLLLVVTSGEKEKDIARL